MITSILKLIRPHQWVKNTFVFLAMIFGGRLLDVDCWCLTLIGALAFCLCSSAVYCLNDILDCEYDRLDPVKCHRPVASCAVSVAMAAATGLILCALGITLSAVLLPLESTLILAAYIILNILYCLWFKHQTLIDVMLIALGFVLRVMMGGSVGQIPLSHWIVIMVFLLTSFLALAKRRHEVMLVETAVKEKGRRSVEGYNIRFIDMSMSILAAVMLVGYITYSVSPATVALYGTDKLYVTSVFVLGGLLRYIKLTVVDANSGNPSMLIFRDVPLRICIVLWLLSFIMIIYVPKFI